VWVGVGVVLVVGVGGWFVRVWSGVNVPCCI
jgi:hypothetical protein